MKTVLIGSAAAQYWFKDWRQPKDEDYLWPAAQCKRDNLEFYDCRKSDGLYFLYENTPSVAFPSYLYALKASHAFWDIHWQKTMADILAFQRRRVKVDNTLFSLLYAGWEQIHGRKRANLMVDNDAFFRDAVPRQYDHDELHRAVAYGSTPMYEQVKPNLSQAYICPDMFAQLPLDQKFQLCREEIYVTALERFLIPQQFRMNSLVAYRGACKLLITSMTKGWFPRFIVENWLTLNRPDEHDFIGKYREYFA